METMTVYVDSLVVVDFFQYSQHKVVVYYNNILFITYK